MTRKRKNLTAETRTELPGLPAHLRSLSPLVPWLPRRPPKGRAGGRSDRPLQGNPGIPRGSGPASAGRGTSLWRRPRCTGHLAMSNTMNSRIGDQSKNTGGMRFMAVGYFVSAIDWSRQVSLFKISNVIKW